MWPIVTLIPMKYALPLKFLEVTSVFPHRGWLNELLALRVPTLHVNEELL